MRVLLRILIVSMFVSGLTPLCRAASQVSTRAHRPTALRRTTTCYDLCELLQAEKKRNPSATKADLAALGNRLIRSRGLPFEFDIGGLLSPDEMQRVGPPLAASHSVSVDSSDGRRVRLRIVGVIMDGLCGESFVSLPVASVASRSATIHTDQGLVRLRVSSGLEFEQMELVDESLTKVLRTWPVPQQTVPRGVSPDGRELYVDYCDELGLALGIGDEGFRLLPTSPEISPEVESIENGPQDPQNAYLSFVKVKRGTKAHYIRFSAPCT